MMSTSSATAVASKAGSAGLGAAAPAGFDPEVAQLNVAIQQVFRDAGELLTQFQQTSGSALDRINFGPSEASALSLRKSLTRFNDCLDKLYIRFSAMLTQTEGLNRLYLAEKSNKEFIDTLRDTIHSLKQGAPAGSANGDGGSDQSAEGHIMSTDMQPFLKGDIDLVVDHWSALLKTLEDAPLLLEGNRGAVETVGGSQLNGNQHAVVESFEMDQS